MTAPGDGTYVWGDPQEVWWTTKDVAAYLRVPMPRVVLLRKAGRLPAPDLTVGRTHAWRPATIMGCAFVEALRR